jgi:hypothetical protein
MAFPPLSPLSFFLNRDPLGPKFYNKKGLRMASRTHTYENLDGKVAANGAKIYVSTLVGASLHPNPTFILDILLALQAILLFLIIYHNGPPSFQITS